MRLDLEELEPGGVHVDLTLRAFPGLRTMRGTVDGSRATPAHARC